MKILILGIEQKASHNWGHTLFRESFQRHHDVDFYGPGYKKYISVRSAVKIFKPNIIFSAHGARTKKEFYDINKTNIPKAIRPHDYFNIINWKTKKIKKPRRSEWQNYFQQCHFDIFFAENVTAYNNMIEDKIGSAYLLPFSVETNLYKPLKLKKDIDVMAVFSITNSYPLRQEIVDLIKKMPLKSIAGSRVVIHQNYINAINRSKIFVVPNGQKGTELCMKYFEVLACGTLLLCQEPPHAKKLGFEKGKNFAVWTDLKDLEDKIWYYLKHKDERKEIAKNGLKLIQERHSNDVRVKEWTKIVNDKFNFK